MAGADPGYENEALKRKLGGLRGENVLASHRLLGHLLRQAFSVSIFLLLRNELPFWLG